MGSLLYMVAFVLSAQFLFSTYHGSALPNLTSTTLSFDDGYTPLFGDSNLMLHRDGKAVHISLNERTIAEFVFQDQYLHGFFGASIKLPSDYVAGGVIAFYMSNGDVFENTHDELDFEFLGNIRGKEWRVQTNVYGNGGTGERSDMGSGSIRRRISISTPSSGPIIGLSHKSACTLIVAPKKLLGGVQSLSTLSV